jgi:hypothetical protein
MTHISTRNEYIILFNNSKAEFGNASVTGGVAQASLPADKMSALRSPPITDALRNLENAAGEIENNFPFCVRLPWFLVSLRL